MQKRTFLGGALAAAALSSLPLRGAHAADAWPGHELKLIIPFAPGGATDVVFRLVSERAAKELGQPIVPVNMGGAGGAKGSTYVRAEKPDGYTLLGGHEFLLTTYHTGMVDFGLDAFEPVATLTFTPMFFSASRNAPYRDFREMADYVRKNPGKAVVAMTPASVQYVMWKQAAAAAGFDFDRDVKTVIISGTGPQTKALLGGHVEAATGDVPSHLPYIKDGRIRVLAVMNGKRLPQLPDVPTMAEQGFPMTFGVTRAVFVPKGTPAGAISRIAAAYRAACTDPAVREKVEELGNLVTFKGPEETGAFFRELDPVFARILRKE